MINRLNANLFKKGLIENPWQRRDQPAQRLRLNANLFKKGLIENDLKRRDGVINRRNGCDKAFAEFFKKILNNFKNKEVQVWRDLKREGMKPFEKNDF